MSVEENPTRGEEFAIESELHRQQNFLVCSVGCPECKAALAEINRLYAMFDAVRGLPG